MHATRIRGADPVGPVEEPKGDPSCPGHESPNADVVARTERHTVLKDGDPADTH